MDRFTGSGLVETLVLGLGLFWPVPQAVNETAATAISEAATIVRPRRRAGGKAVLVLVLVLVLVAPVAVAVAVESMSVSGSFFQDMRIPLACTLPLRIQDSGGIVASLRWLRRWLCRWSSAFVPLR
ncbi:hypothetical protein [Streptomyces sp. 2323.1]|uniref:hypothetical protein n=1 Tax=Streptomyces sp. 2323.1 TaxID=1938841 RepID=UPI0013319C78|nr:hypothetical protein [Streptomyces sp. 2323.1]